ncbi:response regulator transcription factor [Marinicrinis lubricantis]|uniref:Response regulator n=1 Tax=Marinicrinis lubricantis TaxID=2086470 RepID=A0ABW1IQ20_9BACL
MSQNILIVDDEQHTRVGLKRMLEKWSAGKYGIWMAENAIEAQILLREKTVHLLITDIRMPEVSGLNLAEALNEQQLRFMPAVILISGYAEFSYAQQAIQYGVVNYLLKPISRDKLIAAVEQGLQSAEHRNRIGMIEKIVDPKVLELKTDHLHYSEPVKQIFQFVEEHLDISIGLKEAAEHIHMNSSYISALFKEQVQMTFSEYVARRKVQKAKELLVQTNLTISEIADRLGYQTSKYFTKLFKTYEGTSPGQYRTQLSGEAANDEGN